MVAHLKSALQAVGDMREVSKTKVVDAQGEPIEEQAGLIATQGFL